MTITPTGAPSWVKSNDHTTYGGSVNKHNYQSQGAVNPLTDVTAEQWCRLASDEAAGSLTASFADLTFHCHDAAPAAPGIDTCDSPVANPTGTRNGNGDVTWTWAANYTDEFGVAGSIHIAHATVQLHGTSPGLFTVELLDTNGDGRNEVVRVRLFDAAGVAKADAKATLTVYTGSP